MHVFDSHVRYEQYMCLTAKTDMSNKCMCLTAMSDMSNNYMCLTAMSDMSNKYVIDSHVRYEK